MNDYPRSRQAALEGVSGLPPRPARDRRVSTRQLASKGLPRSVVLLRSCSCTSLTAKSPTGAKAQEPISSQDRQSLLASTERYRASVNRQHVPPPRRERPRSPARTSSGRRDQTTRGERRVCPFGALRSFSVRRPRQADLGQALRASHVAVTNNVHGPDLSPAPSIPGLRSVGQPSTSR